MTTPTTNSSIQPDTANDKARNTTRRERISIGRDLYDGNWRRVLLDLNKLTQHKYKGVKNHAGEIKALMVKVNAFRLAAITHADILFNTTPVIAINQDYELQRDRWELVADNCLIESTLHSLSLTCNVETEAWLEIVMENGKVGLCVADGLEVFPIGKIGMDDQPQIIDKRWIIQKKNSQGNTDNYLRVARHSAPNGIGKIENYIFKVQSAYSYDIPNTEPLDLQTVMGEWGDAPLPVMQTGVDRPLLFRFANRTLRGEPQPDISKNDIDLIDQMAATASQLARIMAKHADPKTRVPPGVVNEKTGVIDYTNLDAVVDPNKEYEYITFDGKLPDMLSVLTNFINWLLMILEISPALIGIKSGAAPESYQKLFLESTNTMKRAQRVATTWRPLLERAITTACKYDAQNATLTGYLVDPVSIKLKPGLPRTDGEIHNELADMHDRGQMSQQTMLEQIYGPEQAETELERIQAERSQSVADLMGSQYTTDYNNNNNNNNTTGNNTINDDAGISTNDNVNKNENVNVNQETSQ